MPARALFGMLLMGSISALAGEIGIYVSWQQATPAETRLHLEREVQSQLAATGIQTAWRPLESNAGTELFERVVIVHFVGRCEPRSATEEADESEPIQGPLTVGSAAVTAHGVQPFIEVACDPARQQVERLLPYPRRSAMLGRVLGKIVAHELYHCLTNSTGHDRKGLAKARLSWLELMSSRAGFSAQALARLRALPH